MNVVTIPGPLRSFLRMAGISQKAAPEGVLPLLARNVFAQGYSGGRPTEFLILLQRYVQQARELTALAGQDGVLRLSGCPDAEPLLRVLGYRLRQECGQHEASLETANPQRAFLTIDSGFPLPELEQALQANKPFTYAFSGSSVPLLLAESDWTALNKKNATQAGKDPLDTLLHDPAVARLYWAFSRPDPDTRTALYRSVGLKRLLPYAAALDFYGDYISIRSGHVIVPGGTGAEPAWKELVGASPASPGEFVLRLLAKDKGWLAAYFDALSRVPPSQQAYFVAPARMRPFYEALRSAEPTMEATKGSFRPAPGLVLLVSRLHWDSAGEPLVPGDLEVWKEVLRQHSESKIVRDVGRRAGSLSSADQLVQSLFAVSRAQVTTGPLQLYLALSEIDARRPPRHRLSLETVRLLARKFDQFSDQYRTFSEFSELTDASIRLFLETADSLDGISNNPLRGNALGTFQANVGIWEILARQRQIPSTQMDDSWRRVIQPFAKVRTSAQLYDAGRASLAELFQAAAGKPRLSQDEIIELLAGPHPTLPDEKGMRVELANRIRSVLDSQRLVSLDTLFALGDGLNAKAEGKPVGDALVMLAGELREFEMPRPIFTMGEREEWAAGIYNNSHTELQMKTDLAKVIKGQATHAQLEEARGQLAPFLRDTLVGLNYAYYEPPGAQALHDNPLFVRSHDFAAETVSGFKTVWNDPMLFGEGSPAGGGAHLVGSLADLPYVLAQVEQDFITPENVQALIWRDLVPGLMTSAVLPRWWGVSRNELHAVTLYQQFGEELLTAAAHDEELRNKVLAILSGRMLPQTSEQVAQALRSGQLTDVLPRIIMPADTFYLAVEFQRRFPQETDSWDGAGQELQTLRRQYPDQVSWERLSRDFGVPHPAFAQTNARELLNLAPLPAYAGYSSRLLAESWDSSNLYWARLADESGYSPAMLNRLVPELTRRMVEKVFATDFEDWPALLRAMRETGEDFRQGKLAAAPMSGPSARP